MAEEYVGTNDSGVEVWFDRDTGTIVTYPAQGKSGSSNAITAKDSRQSAEGTVGSSNPWWNTPEGYQKKLEMDAAYQNTLLRDKHFWATYDQPGEIEKYNARNIGSTSSSSPYYIVGGRASSSQPSRSGTGQSAYEYSNTYAYTPEYVAQQLKNYYASLIGSSTPPSYVAPTSKEIRAETQNLGGAEAFKTAQNVINTGSRNALNQVNASGGYLNPFNTNRYIGSIAKGAVEAAEKGRADARKAAVAYLTKIAENKYASELEKFRNEQEEAKMMFAINAPNFLKYYSYA
jgi:hypothetical protein